MAGIKFVTSLCSTYLRMALKITMNLLFQLLSVAIAGVYLGVLFLN